MKTVFLAALAALAVTPALAGTLTANTTSNNNGATAWGEFFDLTATGSSLTVTDLTTASDAAVGATFSIAVYTRSGTALGGTLATGPGSSSAGWTLLGNATVTQGSTTATGTTSTANGISLDAPIPSIAVAAGSTVGVALVFTGAGPRYVTGTGTPVTFTDGPLTMTTGSVRSAPFTTGGSLFTPRDYTGTLGYSIQAVPEPASLAALGLGGLALLRRRKRA